MEKWNPPSGWILECSRGNPLTETLMWWGQASEGLPSHARQTALTGGHVRGQIYGSREDIAVLESSPPQQSRRLAGGAEVQTGTIQRTEQQCGEEETQEEFKGKSGVFLNMGSGEFMPL